MYRHLLPLLLCQAVAPAPQAISDSDITYVKLQQPIEAPTAQSPYRESRIEHLPLTMPGNVTSEGSKINLTDDTVSDLTDSDLTLPESSNLSEITALPEDGASEINIEKTAPDKSESEFPQSTEEPTLTDITVNSSIKPDETVLPEKPEDELLEAHGSDISDTVPSETLQSERRGRTYDSSETTDIFDEATDRYEDVTNIPEVVTRKTPKFVPKLSYFQKPQGFVSFPTNSIEKSAKRRFRSHCRCEKIWNCPKLQITVPRCPNEYFLCCS